MLRSERALKARVNPAMNRAFSARVSIHRFPGALPQVHHGESVLWRTVVECCAFGAKHIRSPGYILPRLRRFQVATISCN
jgi:hypothetical protein